MMHQLIMHQKERHSFKGRKKLALKNALRYFPAEQHAELAKEFADELKNTVVFICTGIVRL